MLPATIPDDVEVAHGEVVDLDRIATDIREKLDNLRKADQYAYEEQLAIGRLLAQARHALPGDQAFGEWFRAQEFGFTQRWGNTLRRAAEHEPAIREVVVGSQLPTGARPNIEKALREVCPPQPRQPAAATPAKNAKAEANRRAAEELFSPEELARFRRFAEAGHEMFEAALALSHQRGDLSSEAVLVAINDLEKVKKELDLGEQHERFVSVLRVHEVIRDMPPAAQVVDEIDYIVGERAFGHLTKKTASWLTDFAAEWLKKQFDWRDAQNETTATTDLMDRGDGLDGAQL
jgi:hypothetical protein